MSSQGGISKRGLTAQIIWKSYSRHQATCTSRVSLALNAPAESPFSFMATGFYALSPRLVTDTVAGGPQQHDKINGEVRPVGWLLNIERTCEYTCRLRWRKTMQNNSGYIHDIICHYGLWCGKGMFNTCAHLYRRISHSQPTHVSAKIGLQI